MRRPPPFFVDPKNQWTAEEVQALMANGTNNKRPIVYNGGPIDLVEMNGVWMTPDDAVANK